MYHTQVYMGRILHKTKKLLHICTFKWNNGYQTRQKVDNPVFNFWAEMEFYTDSEEFTFLIQYYKTNKSSPT